VITQQPQAVVRRDSSSATRATVRVVLLLSAVLTIAFLASVLFSRGGTSELQAARRRVAELEANISRLEAENRKLTAEIESIKQSTFAIERIAREKLGMSRPGETVYFLPAEKPAAP
jgi:cell division protein FtsB